jgi:DNA-binding MarR family transcriptional regulator
VSEPIEPLTPREERAWRAFARALVTVPRALDADLQSAQGMSMGEYFVLMNLSEACDRSLRMSELASRGGLSPSRITRLVDGLVADGLVCRSKSPADGRLQIAVLTDAGLARLKAAYPAHLASVRRNVVDHFGDLDLDELARAATEFAPACPPQSDA